MMKITNIQANIENFHLDIQELCLANGKIHAFIGSNGCGKSTLAKILLGIIPYSGEIEFQGILPTDCILASQRPYLMRASVYENICYPLKIRNIPICEQEIDSYLESFGILDKKFVYARQLSSGQQQKVSIIRTLIAKPKLMIFDETLSNLDIESVGIAKKCIQNAHATTQATIILISHQIASFKDFVDIFHFFDKGKHVFSGSLDGLINNEIPSICHYIDLQALRDKNAIINC